PAILLFILHTQPHLERLDEDSALGPAQLERRRTQQLVQLRLDAYGGLIFRGFAVAGGDLRHCRSLRSPCAASSTICSISRSRGSRINARRSRLVSKRSFSPLS